MKNKSRAVELLSNKKNTIRFRRVVKDSNGAKLEAFIQLFPILQTKKNLLLKNITLRTRMSRYKDTVLHEHHKTKVSKEK